MILNDIDWEKFLIEVVEQHETLDIDLNCVRYSNESRRKGKLFRSARWKLMGELVAPDSTANEAGPGGPLTPDLAACVPLFAPVVPSPGSAPSTINI